MIKPCYNEKGGNMKKIAILSLHLGYGGIEKSVTALANMLCEKYEVEIACTYQLYEQPAFKIDDRVKVKYLVKKYTPNEQEFKKQLRDKKMIKVTKEGIKAIKILYLRRKTMIDYIKNSDADYIISTRDIFDRWLGDYANGEVVKIGWEHNHHHNNKKYALNIIRSSWNLDYLVLVSKDLTKFYRREMLKSKCKCIYIPNVLDSIPKRLAPLKEKRLISVGRLSKEKAPEDLVKIFNILIKKHPDWHLDIIGDGDEREKIENYLKKHNLEEKVTLHGFQNKEYIADYLHKSSLYIMTSLTESFGIVLLEAMSHGLPCVAFSSAEGAREIITSGKNGYLIKNRNYSAMIKKIEDLMKDEEVRKQLGKEARKSIKKYTKEVVQEDWYSLLEKKVER